MQTDHKIYAAFVLLLAAGGGLYMSRRTNAAQAASHAAGAKAADLPSISVAKDDVEKITKLEITTPNKDDKTKTTKVVLVKEGDNWTLSEPLPAKANAANVRSVLDNFKDLKIKESIDHGTGSYDQYEVSDAKAVHVVAFKGTDKAVDLYFGKTGSRGQMARVAGKDGVFAAGGYSSFLYNREVKGWRETAILKFEDANAIQVDVTNKNGLLSFSKNGEKWAGAWTKLDKDGKLDKEPEKDWKGFEEGKVKDLLRAYKGLAAEDFGEAKDVAGSGVDAAATDGGIVHIKLKDNAGDLTIKVGKVAKGTSRYAMKDGGDGTLYVLSNWAADWATADTKKFEKSDEKKDAKKPPPGGMPAGMQMPGMPGGEED